jgi:hypothetical protein
MAKKAVIEVSLVKENAERTNKETEKEIFEELLENLWMIPWAAKVEKVTIIDI